ncbi:MAG: hypothetical protein R6U26_00060 [Candidatus Undinarchaeales archaeon]
MALRTLKTLKEKESEIRKELNELKEEKSYLTDGLEALGPMKKAGKFKSNYVLQYARSLILTFMAFDMLLDIHDELNSGASVLANSVLYKKKGLKLRSSELQLKHWAAFLNKKLWEEFNVNFCLQEGEMYITPREVTDGISKVAGAFSDEGAVFKSASKFLFEERDIDKYLGNSKEFMSVFKDTGFVFLDKKPNEENYKTVVKHFKEKERLVQVVEKIQEEVSDKLDYIEEALPNIVEEYDDEISELEESLERVLRKKEQRKKFNKKKQTKKQKRIEDLKDEANELISVLRELGVEPKFSEKEILSEDAEGELKHILSKLIVQVSKLKNKKTKLIQLRNRTEELMRKLHANNIYQFDYELKGLLDLIPESRDPKKVKKTTLGFIEKELASKKTEMEKLILRRDKLANQAEKSIALCKKYSGKFKLVSDCDNELNKILEKLSGEEEWELNKKNLEKAEEKLDEINDKLSKIGDIIRRGKHLPQKVNISKKKRTLAKHIKDLNLSKRVKELLEKEKFDEIDALFNYTFLLVENSSEIKKKKLEKYFSLLEKGKYRSLKRKISRQKKKKGPDEINQLKEKLSRKTFSNEIILERMRTLFWVLGENDLEQGKQEAEWLSEGHTWERPTTHQTKHVYPSLRDLGLDIWSHSDSGKIKIHLKSKERKKLTAWLKLYELIKEKED